MSAAKLDFTPEALGEIDDAFEWDLARSPQAAEAFLREVESAFALIVSSPDIWPSFEAATRRYILRRFPYNIIYREIAGGIEIVAVAHQKRRPRYWRSRLSRSRTSRPT